jgi:hypothetical protein
MTSLLSKENFIVQEQESSGPVSYYVINLLKMNFEDTLKKLNEIYEEIDTKSNLKR